MSSIPLPLTWPESICCPLSMHLHTDKDSGCISSHPWNMLNPFSPRGYYIYTSFNTKNSAFCPCSVLTHSIWFPHTEFIGLYNGSTLFSVRFVVNCHIQYINFSLQRAKEHMFFLGFQCTSYRFRDLILAYFRLKIIHFIIVHYNITHTLLLEAQQN